MRVIRFFDCLPFGRAAIPAATASPTAGQESTGKTAFYGPCKIRDAGRRPNRPPGGFSGLRPLARLRRAACGRPLPPRTSPPRWAETFSLPANLAFGVSQKPKPPLCKGRRREAPEGSFWDRLQLFQNDGSVTAPPTQGSLREPFRICHNRLFQYAKTPGQWTGGLLALWLPCGEGQGGRS